MAEEKKKRIQISLSETVLERLDKYCEMSGMTRSTYISYVLASSLLSQEQLQQAANNAVAFSVTE